MTTGDILKVLTIDGNKVEIFLSDSDGFFVARDPSDRDDWVRAESLKKLEDKLRRILRTKSLRLEIPMTLLLTGDDYWDEEHEQPMAEPVTLTGVHGSTKKPLLTRANGEKGQYDRDGVLTARVTPDEAAEWIATVQAKRAADKALEALKDRLKLPVTMTEFIKGYVAQHGGKVEDVDDVNEG